MVVNGTVIHPVMYAAGAYSFVVPRDARSVSLVSRLPVPAASGLPNSDGLSGHGLRVTEISVTSEDGEETISADNPRLKAGWHDVEREGSKIWRRIDGRAEIPWDDIKTPALIKVRCSNPIGYPVEIEHGERGRPAYDTINREVSASTALSLGGLPIEEYPNSTTSATARVQWCVGMYSSGSTWIFNAVQLVGDVLYPNDPHVSVYAETADQFPPGWRDGGRVIIKSHHADDVATALLIRHANPIWVSVRDPRDCVASAWTYIFKDFDAALEGVARSALHCGQLLLHENSVLLRYEDRFIDHPSTLDRFASTLSGVLSSNAREALFRKTRRSAIEAMIQNLDPAETVPDGFADNRVHMKTQWHTHHINRTGEVGRWRTTLSPKQADEVQRRLGSWMQKFGYLH